MKPPSVRVLERQPRERAVPCQRCRRRTTWNVSAVCDQCTASQVSAACEVCGGRGEMREHAPRSSRSPVQVSVGAVGACPRCSVRSPLPILDPVVLR